MEFPKIEKTTLNNDKELLKKGFNPKDYLKINYPEISNVYNVLLATKFVKENCKKYNKINTQDLMKKFEISSGIVEDVAIFDFHRIVAQELLLAYPEDNIEVLDVGGGPTIYQHISMSLQAGSITHLEFLKQNREEVLAWLKGEEGSHNWDSYFEMLKIMFKEDQDYQEKLDIQLKSLNTNISRHAESIKNILNGDVDNFKNYLKLKIGSKVVYGDVFSPDLGLENGEKYNVINSGKESSVELLTSNFTIESATSDKKKWEQGIRNIVAKIKNGGYLSLTAIRNADWYMAGTEKMPSVKINENDIISLLKKEGLEIKELRILDNIEKNITGYDGLVFVLAKKII